MEIEKVLISGCLIGLKVRYHGGDAPCHSQIIDRGRCVKRDKIFALM